MVFNKMKKAILFLGLILSLESSRADELPREKVQTSQGNIAFFDNKRPDAPILVFIHGNSASADFFQKQVSSLGKKYRIIIFDSPGCGYSDNAKEPEKVYSFPGVADVLAEALQQIGISKAFVVGWSKGGHEAIELSARHPDLIQGIVITGTPPIPPSTEGAQAGFKMNNPVVGQLMGLSEQFTEEQARTFIAAGGTNPDEQPFLIKNAIRADGFSRSLMLQSFTSGVGINELTFLQQSQTPLMIIMGKYDDGINNDYIKSHVGSFPGLQYLGILPTKHSAFWEKPALFNSMIETFIESQTS